MFAFQQRASAIIYNLLLSVDCDKPFLLPSNICQVVPLTFLKARKSFEFIDISPDTFCMDLDNALEQIKKNKDGFSGIIYVRNYGYLSDVSEYFKKLKELKTNLIIIDDRCLCEPEINPSPDDYTDVLLFSTGYAKYLDIGYGGYGLINKNIKYKRHNLSYWNEDWFIIDTRVKDCVNNGKKFEYRDYDWLDDRTPLMKIEEYFKIIDENLDNIRNHKSQLNSIYRTNLPESIQLKHEFQKWRFNIIVDGKTDLLKEIFANGLFASSHYASLNGIFSDGISPAAENLHSKIINLFNDKYFDVYNAEKICKIINQHIEKFMSPSGRKRLSEN